MGEPEGRRWAGTGFHHPAEAATLETGWPEPARGKLEAAPRHMGPFPSRHRGRTGCAVLLHRLALRVSLPAFQVR